LYKLCNILKSNWLYYFWGILIFLGSSCGSNRDNSGNRVVVDDLGREVKMKEEVHRVMALSSSLTEMLYMICDEKEIIARTHNCNYPPQVFNKPVVSNYPIDYEKLLMLKPDLVFAKDGIVSLEEAQKIEQMGIPVYFQVYKKTDDIFFGLEKLGKVLKKETRAKTVADSLRFLLDRVEKLTKPLAKPSVLMIISKDKIFVYGKDSYGSDMLDKAGGQNAVDSIFEQAYPSLTTEYIMHINPEIIIGTEHVDLHGSFFTMYPELQKVKAYQNKRIYTVPEELISRPGPRVVEGIEILKNRIHPHAK
jgi:iron complex transport system substrate-binding protein